MVDGLQVAARNTANNIVTHVAIALLVASSVDRVVFTLISLRHYFHDYH